MKILIDLSAFRIEDFDGQVTGIANYAFTAVDSLIALGEDEVSLVVVDSVEHLARLRFPLCIIHTYQKIWPSLSKRLRVKEIIDSLRVRQAINRIDCDVVFRPLPGSKFDFLRINKPLVVTIHDLFSFSEKQDYRKSVEYHSMRMIIRNADRVVAISDFTKKDILDKIPGISVEKIETIHNCVPTPNYKEVPINLPKPFILSVNTITHRKNVITLVKAFDELKSEIPHHLVLVGKRTRYYDDVIAPYIESHNLKSRIHWIPYADNGLLYTLYRNTELFVSTSLAEGFGYTPIEAAIIGAKVLCSKVTSLPESTMESVNYYEPVTDEYVLSERIKEVLIQDDIQERKIISERFVEEYSAEAYSVKIRALLNRVSQRV